MDIGSQIWRKEQLLGTIRLKMKLFRIFSASEFKQMQQISVENYLRF